MGDFPDIDFSVFCPICDATLEHDGGFFDCGDCLVSWPRSGYGHGAVCERAQDGLCEARCPSDVDVLYEGQFCTGDLGHPGDHEIRNGTIKWPGVGTDG